jgi:hypothetical protein
MDTVVERMHEDLARGTQTRHREYLATELSTPEFMAILGRERDQFALAGAEHQSLAGYVRSAAEGQSRFAPPEFASRVGRECDHPATGVGDIEPTFGECGNQIEPPALGAPRRVRRPERAESRLLDEGRQRSGRRRVFFLAEPGDTATANERHGQQ